MGIKVRKEIPLSAIAHAEYPKCFFHISGYVEILDGRHGRVLFTGKSAFEESIVDQTCFGEFIILTDPQGNQIFVSVADFEVIKKKVKSLFGEYEEKGKNLFAE